MSGRTTSGHISLYTFQLHIPERVLILPVVFSSLFPSSQCVFYKSFQITHVSYGYHFRPIVVADEKREIVWYRSNIMHACIAVQCKMLGSEGQFPTECSHQCYEIVMMRNVRHRQEKFKFPSCETATETIDFIFAVKPPP